MFRNQRRSTLSRGKACSGGGRTHNGAGHLPVEHLEVSRTSASTVGARAGVGIRLRPSVRAAMLASASPAHEAAGVRRPGCCPDRSWHMDDAACAGRHVALQRASALGATEKRRTKRSARERTIASPVREHCKSSASALVPWHTRTPACLTRRLPSVAVRAGNFRESRVKIPGLRPERRSGHADACGTRGRWTSQRCLSGPSRSGAGRGRCRPRCWRRCNRRVRKS